MFLLVCFDVILFFKQMGLLYRLTRSCRTKNINVTESEEYSSKPTQFLKGIFYSFCGIIIFSVKFSICACLAKEEEGGHDPKFFKRVPFNIRVQS